MLSLVLPLLLAAGPGKYDLCQLIKTGHVAELEAALAKSKLPTCDKPLAILAVGSDKPDDAVIAMLDLLASKGVKLGQALPSGQTALGATTSVGVLRALLARGLPCDRIAAIDQRRDLGRLRVVLEAGCPIDGVLSAAAATRGEDPAVIPLLLSKGAKLDEKAFDDATPLHQAARHASLAFVKALIDAGAAINPSNKAGEHPIDLAVWNPQALEVVELLHARGGTVTSFDEALRTAVRLQEPAVVEWLMSREPRLSATDAQAIHAAAAACDLPLIQRLLALGADIDALDPLWKQTPLMTAMQARAPRCELPKALVGMIKNVDAVNAQGNTALMVAAERNDVEVARALVARGASTTRKNKEGKTALMIADEARALELIALLGADSASPGDGVEALVWGGGTTESDAQKWLGLWTAEAPKYSSLITLAPGFPKVVKSDDVPGMKPGFVVVVLGYCKGTDARLPLGVLKGVAERVYARRVSIESEGACPTRVGDLRRGALLTTTVEGGARLQAGEYWTPSAPRATSWWLTLRTKAGELLEQRQVTGSGSSCQTSGEVLGRSLRLTHECEGEIIMSCEYGPSTTTVDFTVSGGKVKETSRSDRAEGCAFLGCD